ncbi:MAG TPA: hypothetical protein VH396_09555 [Chitinophagaceae bacterium]
MKTRDARLTFPQRNWLLLCIITAIIVAIAYYLIDANIRHKNPTGTTTNAPSAVSNGGDTAPAQGIPPDSLKH